ncbi:anaerobic sulfatase maturase [Caldicoprobacter algeriensis]|uniref:anaerobic sulfatase maturase n=1 Tax=Caldicoprobacter algeriensis TaxID=699281 RepID=UPI002079A3DA|nr:anaerobic sulfatase maturase [Caldicoprobacter algeriensis]MCM8899948.1 anaerobic sulfatase maturase [Caldicoprobacter algeriensis]
MVKPFSLLIKPASADCNLRCQYCFYIDKSLLYPETHIHRMPDDVLERMISTYMATEQPVYSFGWQGGEPTLMGVRFFEKVVSLQQRYGRLGAKVSNGLQTNATLIDDELAALLAQYNFLVGVSLDGPEELHDHYRRTAGGQGTHSMVLKGIECLRKNRVEFNILTLVNAKNAGQGREIYQYLKDMGCFYHQYIPCVEFDEKGNPMPYTVAGEEWGRFLCEIFDEWIKSDVYRVSVRIFDSILNFLVDGIYTTCHLAGNCCQYFVVEYNGDIYPCDFFVTRQLKLGNVMEDSWEELQNSPTYVEFGKQKAEWNSECQRCRWLYLCSGDCLKHRLYGGGNSSKLSWLCAGWKKFFEHSMPYFKQLALKVLKERERAGIIAKTGRYELFPEKRLGRNDTCFCGSGKKYKKCHGNIDVSDAS